MQLDRLTSWVQPKNHKLRGRASSPGQQKDTIQLQGQAEERFVSFRYPTKSKLVKTGLSSLLNTFRQISLPVLATAYAGYGGFVAAVGVETAIGFLKSNMNVGKAALATRNSLAGGLVAGVAGKVAASTLGLPALAVSLSVALGAAVAKAGYDMVQAARTPEAYQLHPDALAREILKRTGGSTENLHGDELRRATLMAVERFCQQHQIHPMVLAGEVAKDLFSDKDKVAFDRHQRAALDRLTVETKVIDGVKVHYGFGHQGAEMGHLDTLLGEATLQRATVHVNARTSKVFHDFLVGHEISHVRHEDSLAGLGGDIMLRLFEQEFQRLYGMPMPPTDWALAPGYQIEHRCDREGFDFAREQGHSDEEILEVALATLGGTPPGPRHPAGDLRVAALKQYAATR